MKKLITIFALAALALSACSSEKAAKMADNVNKKAEKTKDQAVENTKESANETAEETKKEAMTVDVVDTLAKEGHFTTLISALNAAGLAEQLKGDGPFTLMAPNDAAFQKLPAGTVEAWLKPENKDKLAAVLKYHVVPGKHMAADMKTMEVDTLNGAKAKVTAKDDGTVLFSNAKVIQTDIEATNGVVHVIDTVVMPPQKKDATAQK